MKTVKISLNSIDKVKAFVNDITKFDYDFDLVSGRYVIDAKSIMGIFSLDLSKPIELVAHTDDATAREFLYFLDDAIENISARSALIGAYMNRVESAVDAISVQKENIVSAN